jgi:hypothetical protein
MKTDVSEIKWLKGGLYGAITYFTALLFTGMWFYFDHYKTPIRASLEGSESPIGATVAAAVGAFYNGQFVPGQGDTFLVAFGSAGGGYLLTPVYRIVPVVIILLVAGAFVYTEADPKDRIGAFLSGASLAIGYFVLFLLVVIGLNSLVNSLSPENPYFPISVGRAVISGILFPVLLGGVAGIAANELKGYFGEKSSAAKVEET